MTIGLLLLAAALGLTGYNIYESKQAQMVSEKVLDEMKEIISEADEENVEEIPDYVKYPEKEMPTVKIDEERYCGILEIPALSLSLPVTAGEWSYAKLKNAPCIYSGSVYKDNMVIAAHNYRSHFGKINTLDIGSELYFTDTEGNMFKYIVGWIDIIQPTDVEGMQNGEDWDLTLFTCTYSGQERYTIRCIRQE